MNKYSVSIITRKMQTKTPPQRDSDTSKVITITCVGKDVGDDSHSLLS